MTNIKAILVDDEQAALNVLSSLLQRAHPNIEIAARCRNVLEAVAAIREHEPDVVFLDVEMPQHAGYKLIDYFPVIAFKIIFVTAYDRYAIRAFELCAVDYLMKPIDRERLRQAILKLQNQLSTQRELAHYKALATSLRDRKNKQIVIPELGSKQILALENIIAIEAQRAYSIVYRMDNKKSTVSKSLAFFESKLTEDDGFYRIHKSWIINACKVQSISKAQRILRLEGGIEAKIARVRYSRLEEKLFQ